MNLELTNRQNLFRLHCPNLSRLTRWLVRRVEAASSVTLPSTLSLVCLDDPLIREAHASSLGRDEPTDVLSFLYPPSPGGGGMGEILVNVQRASEEGGGRGGGPDRELALYVAHGLHHLAGADDDTPSRRRAMLRQEARWLDQASRCPVWAPLFVSGVA